MHDEVHGSKRNSVAVDSMVIGRWPEDSTT